MAALELVAMDMKAQGMYVSRTLSFAGAEFETVQAPLEEPLGSQYAAAAAAWASLFTEFLYAEELVRRGCTACTVGNMYRLYCCGRTRGRPVCLPPPPAAADGRGR